MDLIWYSIFTSFLLSSLLTWKRDRSVTNTNVVPFYFTKIFVGDVNNENNLYYYTFFTINVTGFFKL